MAESIAGEEVGPAALLEWDEPMALAFYPDHAAKSDLVARMRALAEPRQVREVRRVEDALAFLDSFSLVIVEPDDEVKAVSFLDRNREHFVGDDVKARLLVLLLRGGAGDNALKDLPALSSFAREASFEVVGDLSPKDRRAAFQERYGATPEEWLQGWRKGELSDTLENNLTLGEALELEEGS